MRTIALSAFRSLDMTNTCRVPLLPAILALRDAWIYVGTSYHSNNVPNIETSVDNFFSIITVLGVPNIYHVVENVVVFENMFDILRSDMCV